MQLSGNVKAFAYRVLTVLKDALLEHPDPRVRAPKDLEEVLQLRLIVGSPPQSGPSDPDRVGFVDWQPVIYASNLNTALTFIHFMLEYKVQKDLLPSMPELAVYVTSDNAPAPPAPWQAVTPGRITSLPSPFCVLPPKGRRHVLAQLEKDTEDKEGEEDSQNSTTSAEYILTFRGNLYPFKEQFDDKEVPGTFVEMDATGQKDYARFLQFSPDDEKAKIQVQSVLEIVLQGMPIYFINMAVP